MAKRYIVLAVCTALVLMAVQTPDVHANKLPAGFVDRTHVLFGTGWDELCASALPDSTVPTPQVRFIILPFTGTWIGNFWLPIIRVRWTPDENQTRQSINNPRRESVGYEIKRTERGTNDKKRTR